MEINNSVLFQTTFRIKNQVSDIINQKSVEISNQEKFDLKKNFKRFINVKKILGNYGLQCFGGSFIIFLIIFGFLLIRFKSQWIFYIVYISLALFVSYLAYLMGKRISKNSREIKKLKIYYFYLDQLLQWTIQQLNSQIEINKKRFLVENYLQCCFDFVHQTQEDYDQLKNNVKYFQQFVQRDDFLECIKLTIGLFETVYRQDNKYQQQGVIVLVKILQPVTYIQKKSSLNKYINELQTRFLGDTNINTFNEYLVKIEQPDINNKLIIYQDFVEQHQNIFKLFVNYWKVNYQNKIFENYKIFAIKYCDQCGDQCTCNMKQSQNIMKISSTSHRQSENKSKNNFKNHIPEVFSNWSKLVDDINNINIEKQKNSTKYLDEIEQDVSIVTDKSIEDQQNQQNILEIKPVDYFEFEKNDIKNSQLSYPIVESMLEIYNKQDDEFEDITNKTDLKVQKLKLKKGEISTVKSKFIFNASKDDIYKMIFDFEERVKWDTIITELKLLKKYDQNSDLIYTYVKTPFIIEDRDFVIERVILKDYKNFDYIVAQKSKDDPNHPPIKKVVRAQIKIQGFIIKQINDLQTEVHLINQTDFGGTIPKSLITKLTVKAPGIWKKNFESGLKKYLKNK